MSEKEFLKYIREELELEDISLSLHSVFRELPNWSSLNALLIVSRINDEHNVLISTAELAECKTLEDIFNRVRKKL